MFVWIFHRISGLVLIVLITLQLLSGYLQSSISDSDWVHATAELHNHAVLNCLIVFLFIFHSLYGIRTILMDLGFRREKLLFWGFSALGLALFGGFLLFYLRSIAG